MARSADGVVRVGRTAPGRGAWLCRDAPECFERARARRALARALRIELSDEDVVEIGVRLYGDRGEHVPVGPGRSSPGMR